VDAGQESGEVKWYYRPASVLLIIFLVAGPLGLPLVYRSPRFSRLARILVTAAMIPYTWFMVVSTIEAFRRVFHLVSLIRQGQP